MGARMAAPETVLTPVATFETSFERGDLTAAAAVDADDVNSRWGSKFTDDESMTLDFGSTQLITRVRIKWENAHAIKYLLQVSDDNANWTTIKTVDDSAGGVEDLTGLNGQGRYLRVQGVKRSTQYGYSIIDIKAFSGTPAEQPPTEPTDPTNPTDPNTPPVVIDPTKPGVLVKPVDATSSEVENNDMSALKAIDGKLNTRWGSKAENGAWIQFDFGAKTPIGYMKLQWENAYGKEYALNVSDDGKTWKQVRYVTDAKGGIEEFYNLGIDARFVRLQGVTRATNYGYSLFEVEFKTPGNDNTLGAGATTSPVKFPANGAGWAPLPGSAQPLETLQFTLADGTLVTRFGARGVGRHGRERGEDWEIGVKNETVDPVTGLPVDKGPGNYFSFVPNYFKNRTWGVEIIDNSRVAGVTKPRLVVNEYFGQANLAGGIAFFRAFDRPGATGYGWMNNGALASGNNTQTCKSTAIPTVAKLNAADGINSSCTILINDYPNHGLLDAEGNPTGKGVDARALVVGDAIEVSPSMFAPEGVMAAKGDSGGGRYYSTEFMYVVGGGIRPWYGIQPRLNSIPLPDSTLSGGLGSVSYNYADDSLFIFQQPFTNIGMQNMQRFVEGRRLVHTNFTTGDHNEPGNDRYQAAVGLQGQRFNQSACIGCHVNNGRSPAPLVEKQRLDSMSVHVAVTGANGQQLPHPQYGTAVQMNAVSASGTPQSWGTGVRVAGFDTRTAKLADGTAVELRTPKLAFEGAVPELTSLRAAQPMFGTGLLEAVPEADILARANAPVDGDGVKGVANFVFEPETGAVRLGRFGWKASKATLRHQAASALLQDMSVTSPVYPNRSCATDPAGCAASAPQKGITEADLQSISRYLALVAVPAQRSLSSGWPKGVSPIEDLNVDPAKVNSGAAVFGALRCVACHTAEMKTGSNHLFAELRNQTIRPYSDLLLHNMGEGLADKLVEGQAKGNMWRTAPLWGIGYTEKVLGANAKVGYLHDGRARNLTEAIMWHDGEGAASRQRFEKLSKKERDDLMAFLRSL
jgi:CxxC motif-containing protein (DUF1111 family)